MQTKNTTAALTLLENSLDFRVQLQFQEMEYVLSHMEIYNNIPDNISEIVAKIKSKIQPAIFGQKNINNGSFCNVKMWIGNESSLVIYVRVDISYNDQKIKEVETILGNIGENFRADAMTITKEHKIVMARFWWD